MNDDNEPNLLETCDAKVWADTFIKYKNSCNWTLNDIDDELMIGWFANCMYAMEMVMQERKEIEDRRWYHTWLHLDGVGVTIRDIDRPKDDG